MSLGNIVCRFSCGVAIRNKDGATGMEEVHETAGG